jgi:hypothetical protein
MAGLSRPSTSLASKQKEDVDARDKPGHDVLQARSAGCAIYSFIDRNDRLRETVARAAGSTLATIRETP